MFIINFENWLLIIKTKSAFAILHRCNLVSFLHSCKFNQNDLICICSVCISNDVRPILFLSYDATLHTWFEHARLLWSIQQTPMQILKPFHISVLNICCVLTSSFHFNSINFEPIRMRAVMAKANCPVDLSSPHAPLLPLLTWFTLWWFCFKI